jgi:hypothetical protein
MTYLSAAIAIFLVQVVAAAYPIANVADTNGQFQQLGPPSVAGTHVVFYGVLKSGVRGIYSYQNGAIKTIADTTTFFSSFDVGGNSIIPDVNAAGDVAFVGKTASGSLGVYKYSHGQLAVVASTANGVQPQSNAPSINDAGTVVFRGASISTPFTARAFAGDGNTPAVSYSGSFTSMDNPSISNTGLVAFLNNPTSIGFGDGANAHTVPVPSSTSWISMNNNELVSFVGKENNEGKGIYTVDAGGVVTTVAVPNEQFPSFYAASSPPINDHGDVAIQVGTSLINGLFISDGGGWSKIVESGDPLFGSTLISQPSGLTGHNGLSDEALAFRYFLADGTSGIALAYIPEPFSLGGLWLVAWVMVLRRRQGADKGSHTPMTLQLLLT